MKENLGGKIIVHVFDPEDIKTVSPWKISIYFNSLFIGEITSVIIGNSILMYKYNRPGFEISIGYNFLPEN